MNRVSQLLANKKDKLLVPYICAGDPSLDITKQIILSINGVVDMIHLGIPFSDPIAQSPTTQKSSLRALDNGVKLINIFDMIEDIRNTIETPICLVLYANTIYKYGLESFLKKCNTCGIDAILVLDLPIEEGANLRKYAKECNIRIINIVCSNSNERNNLVLNHSDNYVVSMMNKKIDSSIIVLDDYSEGVSKCINNGVIVAKELIDIIDTNDNIVDNIKTMLVSVKNNL